MGLTIGGIKTLNPMWKVYVIMFIVTSVISWLWATGIDKQAKYKKENPDYNENEGWLDWDCNNAHTEGDL